MPYVINFVESGKVVPLENLIIQTSDGQTLAFQEGRDPNRSPERQPLNVLEVTRTLPAERVGDSGLSWETNEGIIFISHIDHPSEG
jgi:hypothetical protein